MGEEGGGGGEEWSSNITAQHTIFSIIYEDGWGGM